MKFFFTSIIIIFFISLVFCKEDEKYNLVYGNIRDSGPYKLEFKIERELSFNLPGFGYVKYAATTNNISEYIGREGEFYKFKNTMTDIKTDDYINGIELIDYYWLALEDSPCFIYISSNGDNIDHIKPVNPEHDYLQEAFEHAHMGVEQARYKYPFGEDAVNIAIGDSWSHIHDSLKFYVNMGSPPSFVWDNTTNTLKKVKVKKGRKIAYIESISDLTMQAQILVDFHGTKQLIAGKAIGTSEGKYQFDIENRQMLYIRTVNNMVGDWVFDGRPVKIKMSRRFFLRLVK